MREAIKHGAQLVGFDVRAEQLRAGFQAHTFGEWSDEDGIETEIVDDGRGRGDGAWSVAGEGDGLASGRAARARPVLEVVVAHVVERLDHVGLGQERLY